MAWGKETMNVECKKKLFIESYCSNQFYFSDLCKHYDICRPAAYNLIERFFEEGFKCLKERDKTPINQPNKTAHWIENEILTIKSKWSKWGAKKVLGQLIIQDPTFNWPCATTIENILKKNGLVVSRKLRKRFAHVDSLYDECNASNDLWCIDFKGWWLTQDQIKIEPFTLTDSFSRYLLCCQNLHVNNSEHVWAVFQRLFREYGLPLRVKSDNGPPFATLGAGRLSRLSINLIKAGVIPEWIEPGEPQQNGRHERMHLTLKQEAMDQALNFTNQVKKLEEFQQYYNLIRPHEALAQKRPVDVYQSSERYWDGKLKSPEYSSDYQIGRVKKCGKMSFRNKEIYIGRVFEGELIGMKKVEDTLEAYFGDFFLGIVKENNLEVKRRLGRKRN